ncbi:MAG: heme biosynthesis HemY N-terminal domain-containing protein [Endozoicomonas sp. (ex Botrylloides leachii)]|nr:heme biosynthesis HemY N-terminal domain-containing protein [Endozoicomonas sp. (ex Botrylloides leachii)]
MKKFFIFLLVLASVFLLANAMVDDRGYVLIAYDGMSFESSLWGFLLLVVISIALTYSVTLLFRIFGRASSIIYPVTPTARIKRARRFSQKGLSEFTNGNWKKAEKLLAQAAENGESPLINYLTAARAAHESGNDEASTEYLRHADEQAPGAEIAVGITQAQLQLSGGQLEQALATLTNLHKKKPHHTYILKLLKKVYVRLNDWQSVAKLLPQLKKYKVIDEIKYRRLEKQVFETLFEQAYRQGKSQSTFEKKVQPASKIWNSLSYQQRRNTLMLFRYTQTLVKLGAEKKAERLLRENLKKHYSNELIRLYGQIKGKDINKQLLTAEALLTQRTNDPELLLTLGRLAIRNKLWGKAKEYFEASLRLRKCIDVYNELGRLLAHLDHHEQSSRYFREGLNQATGALVPLPIENS